MTELNRYQLIFDPYPTEEQVVEWSKVVPRLARIFLRPTSRRAIFEASDALAVSISTKGRMSGPLGGQMHRTVRQALANIHAVDDGMLSSTCGILAALHLLNNRRLKGANAEKRETLAIALWAALSGQTPLLEPRLEELRIDLLDTAQYVALDMAGRLRQRRSDVVRLGSGTPAPGGGGPAVAGQTIAALRWNSILDQEEIDLLRWMLTDESRVLQRPFGELKVPETLAVTLGLELGGLLRWFPTLEHYIFVAQDCSRNRSVGVQGLLEGLGKDRDRLAALYRDDPVVQACPAVFPFLTALSGGCVEGSNVYAARPLVDWCGRALLESAAVVFANTVWRRS